MRRPERLFAVLVVAVAVCATACGTHATGAPDLAAPVVVTVPADSSVAGPPPVTSVDEAPAPPTAESSENAYPYENTAPEISVAEDTRAWPAPPADPSAAVTAAVGKAAAAGIEQSVVIIDRASGAVLTQLNPEEPYPALSLVKLMIAADVLTGGGAGLDEESAEVPGPAGSSVPTPTAASTSASASRSSPGVAAATVDAATLARLREMIARSDDVTAADFYAEGGSDELIDRVVQRFSLTGTSPTPDGEYWGNVQTTAADMASLIRQIQADPDLWSVIGPAMEATSAFAEDGVDQRFGMRTVPGAGSKQGWGCCLSGVTGVHSVGYTDDRIVVVLSGAEPDDYSLGSQDGLALEADSGGQASIAAVTATVRAALGGPLS